MGDCTAFGSPLFAIWATPRSGDRLLPFTRNTPIRPSTFYLRHPQLYRPMSPPPLPPAPGSLATDVCVHHPSKITDDPWARSDVVYSCAVSSESAGVSGRRKRDGGWWMVEMVDLAGWWSRFDPRGNASCADDITCSLHTDTKRTDVLPTRTRNKQMSSQRATDEIPFRHIKNEHYLCIGTYV